MNRREWCVGDKTANAIAIKSFILVCNRKCMRKCAADGVFELFCSWETPDAK